MDAPPRALDDAVGQSLAYLRSEGAIESLGLDPYWPKWNSPWWHMTLLWEIGLSREIPRPIIEAMIKSVEANFLKFFPFTDAELPPGKDAYHNVGCHCALGTLYQVLCDCGVDVDERLPWIRSWFLKYQLPDGGLNCEPDAYTKESPKSSIVSTLPPLESILLHTHRPFTEEETRFLDRGAAYLIAHRLVRSARTGELITKEWMELCFPRFYAYDVLRGLAFLARWAAMLGRPLPDDAIGEAVRHLDKRFPDGRLRVERGPQAFPASTFPLLLSAGEKGKESPWLSGRWNAARKLLGELQTRK